MSVVIGGSTFVRCPMTDGRCWLAAYCVPRGGADGCWKQRFATPEELPMPLLWEGDDG